MQRVYISGTGLYTPPETISNEELVKSFNYYAARYNEENMKKIRSKELKPIRRTGSDFIYRVSGVKSRYVVNKSGILDPEVMCPLIKERSDNELSIQAEIAVLAAKDALKQAKKTHKDVDLVIVASSTFQRAYPSISIEVQQALNINGFAFDLMVACSSATFGIQTAVAHIKNASAKCALVINPEICTGHTNFKDRDSHFLFGDAATAVVVENENSLTTHKVFEIKDIRSFTSFSNNIRNNFGFLNRSWPETANSADKLFSQNGSRVFKNVVEMVSDLIGNHLTDNDYKPANIKRFWLHQANININHLIVKRIIGKEPTAQLAPDALENYGNTSSAGSMIVFHKFRNDLKVNDLGVICAFGAGYSASSIIIQKV